MFCITYWLNYCAHFFSCCNITSSAILDLFFKEKQLRCFAFVGIEKRSASSCFTREKCILERNSAWSNTAAFCPKYIITVRAQPEIPCFVLRLVILIKMSLTASLRNPYGRTLLCVQDWLLTMTHLIAIHLAKQLKTLRNINKWIELLICSEYAEFMIYSEYAFFLLFWCYIVFNGWTFSHEHMLVIFSF